MSVLGRFPVKDAFTGKEWDLMDFPENPQVQDEFKDDEGNFFVFQDNHWELITPADSPEDKKPDIPVFGIVTVLVLVWLWFKS